jgi:hypothetical protein
MKRGPKMPGRYTASRAEVQPTRDQADFVERRVAPFLDRFGMGRPLTVLLQEAYMQGMRDTLEALAQPNPHPHTGMTGE